MTNENQRIIFIVEDDPKIAAVLRDYLFADGYAVEQFGDGRTPVAAVRNNPPSAILLDLNLPGMDGVETCQQIRKFSAVPILMLTARVDEIDRLTGLDIGADDYICKPFSANEVMSRVRALIRRAEGRVVSDQAVGLPFAIDHLGQRIAWRGMWLSLSPAEYGIAAAMMTQPGRVFSRDQLLDKLGERSDESSDRAIDSHMKNIRRKFAAADPAARCFVAVYGMGYRFEP